MKLALASLETEAVAWIVHARTGDQLTTDGGYVANAEGILGLHSTPLYTAPPTPVSVPDELTREEYKRRFMEEDNFDDTFRGGWNAFRAAMLQGAEPVTTDNKLPFEQWLSQQTGTIDVECGCVMTEVFFHWLRVAYEAGNSPVIQDGWVACSERMPEESGRYWCYVEEQNDLGKSHYQWNCAWNGKRWWVEHEDGGRVTHWQPLHSPPAK
ncbi:TPA: DUF551 domain-containing protein [Enterobacter hormaechei]|nr:DUF551 domain-containing protein [Enterobacter hormaechei]HCU0179922.1 DUF551 domain-containing protein [Enterobacter hormaechei]